MQTDGKLTVNERKILTAVNAGASALSLIGSAFIVLSYLLFLKISASSLSSSSSSSPSLICSAVSSTSSGTSLAMTVIRTIGDNCGRLDAWCWPETGRTGKEIIFALMVLKLATQIQAVHFVTFYAPLWGAILFNGFTYLQVIRMLKNATRMAVGMSDRIHQFSTRVDKKALNRWGYYPLILIGSWAFGTINCVHDFIEPGHEIFCLSFLDVGMAALMGLFNSVAYGFNSSVRRAICERLDRWWPERLRRWLPTFMRLRVQQQEASELVALKVQDQQ